MKTIIFTLAGVFLSGLFCDAQYWVQQGPGWTELRKVQNIFVVNESVIWVSAGSRLGPLKPCYDISRTIDGGNTWTPKQIPGVEGSAISMICAVDSLTAWVALYKTTENVRGIFKTTDGGNTWMKQGNASMYSDSLSFPNVVYFWDANTGVAIGDPVNNFFEIYVTTNGGSVWHSVPGVAAVPNEKGLTADYSVIGNNIWFGTNRCHIIHSSDRGNTWTVSTVAVQTSNKFMLPAMKDTLNGFVLRLWGDSLNLLSKTANGGISYDTAFYSGKLFNYGLSYIPGSCCHWISIGGDTLLPHRSGISYSLDDGETFLTDTAFIDVPVTAQAFVNDSLGWVGGLNTGPDDGIYKRVAPVIITGTKDKKENAVKIYPVPAHRVLNVKSDHVLQKIELYDLHGVQVLHLDHPEKHQSLNISALSEGLYTVRILTDDGTVVRRVVVRR